LRFLSGSSRGTSTLVPGVAHDALEAATAGLCPHVVRAITLHEVLHPRRLAVGDASAAISASKTLSNAPTTVLAIALSSSLLDIRSRPM
jgi:hypothetical protein